MSVGEIMSEGARLCVCTCVRACSFLRAFVFVFGVCACVRCVFSSGVFGVFVCFVSTCVQEKRRRFDDLKLATYVIHNFLLLFQQLCAGGHVIDADAEAIIWRQGPTLYSVSSVPF